VCLPLAPMSYPFVSLVIPCFNEAGRLVLLLQGLEEFAAAWPAEWEAIVVDDGSTDDTAAKLNTALQGHALEKQIRILNQANAGKGAALKTGVEAALGEFILTLDADMATRPAELLHWWEKRKGFYPREILIGSRELPQSDVLDLGYRRFIGHVFNRVIRIATGLPIRDTQCGFKLYDAAAAKALFAALRTPGWAHDVELLKRANRAGYAIVEMPIRWRAIEGSKIRVLRDSWAMFVEVLRIGMMRMG